MFVDSSILNLIYDCPRVHDDPNCDAAFYAPYSGAKVKQCTADLQSRRDRRDRSPT